MTSSLSSALSSMEVMLDALMQRGIGKPEDRTREETPPALPTRPTVRGRPPSSSQRPGAPVPWLHREPDPLPPLQEEPAGKQYSFNVELERRAVKAEEDARQKDDDVRQKEEEIAVLRQQVEHYERRLSECEIKMKTVEEVLQRQITALQIAQNTRSMASRSTTTLQHRRSELSASSVMARSSMAPTRAEESSSDDHQQRSCEPDPEPEPEPEPEPMSSSCERQSEVDAIAAELQRQNRDFELSAKAAADELQTLKRQFSAWKKEYEAELLRTKAEITKKRAHAADRSRCSWWRKKVVAKCCKAPSLKCCTPKLRCPTTTSCCHCPTAASCCLCNCFRRCPTPASCCFCSCFRRCFCNCFRRRC